MQIITGFHAIEELLRTFENETGSTAQKNKAAVRLLYAKTGPRVKKILAQARNSTIAIEQTDKKTLDNLVASLPAHLRDHRGIVLTDSRTAAAQPHIPYETAIANLAALEKAVVVVLDSITDPHNIGAIIRSAEQFGIAAVILPERKTAGDMQTITKISAGAAAWVPLLHTANLVRAVETLKENGFWVFGADVDGEPLPSLSFPDKTVLIMGSEGSGISRLLKKSCDSFTAIPTVGKLDSLNVSVAAGILMYEVTRNRK